MTPIGDTSRFLHGNGFHHVPALIPTAAQAGTGHGRVGLVAFTHGVRGLDDILKDLR